MKKLHLICNAHIDPVWQWEWEEGASSALSTFQSAVNLADEFDYIFCHNEATLYKYIERFAPTLFEKIKRLVKLGKWRIMGGWYLQPDCLLPDGEGFVRQIRIGEKYFKEKFGVKPEIAVNFDPFGHSRGLVQIIAGCGQKGYAFMRPYSEHIKKQLDLPAEYFIWEGYDGSRIKARRITEYSSPLGGAAEKIKKDVERLGDEEISVSTWGVGNHGGGPSRKDLADIAALTESSKIQIVHSTFENYFDEVVPEKVFDGSLISCMPGCYSSMIGLKQKYRELERSLFFTEKLLSAAAIAGAAEYPSDRLDAVTEDMLNVQFHDMLPGTTIKEGEQNALAYIYHGLRELNDMRADGFFALCKGQSVAEDGTYPILAFNPKAYGGEQIVECELSIIPTDLFKDSFSRIAIFDEQGNRLVSQTVKERSNISMDWRKRVVFKGHLNPLSITRFTAKTEVKPNETYPVNKDVTFDNGKKRVFINSATGLIESYVVDGVEYAAGKMFEPFAYEDNADPWGMSDEQTNVGIGKNPVPFEKQNKPDGVFDGLQSFEIIEDGDIYIAAESFFAHGTARLRIGYKIYKQGDAVDVDVQLFPGEANEAVKLHVPTLSGEYIGDQVFGTEKLYDDGRECVSHEFVAVKCKNDGYLQLITPTTYASSYKDGEIRITLHRGVAYCAHPVSDRPLLKDNAFVQRMDRGECDYNFRLCVSDEKSLEKNALEFSEPPYALNVFPTADESADNGTRISVDNPNIRTVTVKKGSMQSGYVFRLFNNGKENAEAVLSCGNAKIRLNFGKYAIKTVLYENGNLCESKDIVI